MKSHTLRTIVGCLALLVLPALAEAQSISCTDATATNCTVKKNQPFQLTQDPALTTDTIATEKYRIYLDGARIGEQANTGAAAVWSFATGLGTPGTHTLYTEAVATGFSSSGALTEIVAGPSNVVTLNVVTGSLSAPKNVRIIK